MLIDTLQLIATEDASRLSPREEEIASCLLLQMSEKEISSVLRIAHGTVHTLT